MIMPLPKWWLFTVRFSPLSFFRLPIWVMYKLYNNFQKCLLWICIHNHKRPLNHFINSVPIWTMSHGPPDTNDVLSTPVDEVLPSLLVGEVLKEVFLWDKFCFRIDCNVFWCWNLLYSDLSLKRFSRHQYTLYFVCNNRHQHRLYRFLRPIGTR